MDFKFYKENFLIILSLIVSIVFIKIFNLETIEENTLLENLQLAALFGGFFVSIKTKNHKTFFTFLAMLFLLMLAREVSYGRVFINEEVVHFNKKLCHILVGIYIGIGILYALIKKIWIDIINMIKNIKFPIWTFLIAILCVLIQIISEKTLHNSCIEETVELMLYCTMVVLVLIYKKK